MPQPNGYRKALRFMKHADKFGLPIVTFVDTPGAFAGKSAEESGQARHLTDAIQEEWIGLIATNALTRHALSMSGFA